MTLGNGGGGVVEGLWKSDLEMWSLTLGLPVRSLLLTRFTTRKAMCL